MPKGLWRVKIFVTAVRHMRPLQNRQGGFEMKAEIHPKYHQTTISCACGNVLEVGSTKKDIRVEICSKCHPFFTGKQKLVDTAGRIERFRKKYAKFQKDQAAAK